MSADGPPELEDVEDVVRAAPVKAGYVPSVTVAASSASATPASPAAATPSDGEITLRELMMDAAIAANPRLRPEPATAAPASAAPAPAKSSSVKPAAATGFKKGFLLGGASGTKSKEASSGAGSVPTIAPQAKTSALVLPEVQEAMQDAMPPMQRLAADTQKWLTPDLLARISGNPALQSGMSNPRFMAAIAELQKDPRAALLRFKDDKPLMEFLRAFMSVMGDHLSKIDAPAATAKPAAGTGATPAAVASLAAAASAPSRQLPKRLIEEVDGVGPSSSSRSAAGAALPAAATIKPEDIKRAAEFAGADDEVRRVLSNPVLAAILGDPVIQRILSECREDGSRIRKYMQVPEVARKLRTLAEHGLVSIVS